MELRHHFTMRFRVSVVNSLGAGTRSPLALDVGCGGGPPLTATPRTFSRTSDRFCDAEQHGP
jgi:hypothetical protein